MNKKILVSVAWPYVNGNIHVGHLAGYLIPADITARFFRLIGDDVLMVSGSDAHGTPITVEADKTKKTPKEVVDYYHKLDIELFRKYQLSYNLYTKTTTKTHKAVTQDLFLKLLEKGFILKKTESQYYSEQDNKFLPDRYVEGTCPHCGTEDQRGDQCENCGRMIDAGTLIDPKSKLTGAPVTLKQTEHYYLDLSKLQDKLKKYVESKKDTWREWVYAEAYGWINEGLKPRAITRDIDWGVEIPKEEIEKINPKMLIDNIDNKRFYVWFDAVIGYLSASEEFSKIFKTNDIPTDDIFNKFQGQSGEWKDWWFNKDAYHYYFMGQDNVVFHTIMWQGELLGAFGEEINLPDNVAANKFMNFKGKKFSKSRGWVVDSHEIADEFGVDPVRFFIASNLPENKEANFTWEDFIDTINNELVANLGNLVNRTLIFFEKFFDGELEINESIINREFLSEIEKTLETTQDNFKNVEITKSIQEIMKLASYGNKYFNDTKIWEVIKNDNKGATKIISNLLHLLITLSVLISPFMPEASDKLREMMGLKKLDSAVGENFWKFEFVPNIKLAKKVEPLFPKIDREIVLKKKNS